MVLSSREVCGLGASPERLLEPSESTSFSVRSSWCDLLPELSSNSRIPRTDAFLPHKDEPRTRGRRYTAWAAREEKKSLTINNYIVIYHSSVRAGPVTNWARRCEWDA